MNVINEGFSFGTKTSKADYTAAMNIAKASEKMAAEKSAAEKAAAEKAAKKTGAKADDGATVEISNAGKDALKMNETDRKALVQQLKSDQESRQNQLISMAQQMMSQQTSYYAIANNTTNVWRFLASGKFTVDAQTKADAQAAISEDGYYGVKQTSERLFQFAAAIAGDDPEKMEKMQAAMQKGFAKAEKTWGKELPEICKQTMDAANKLFEDYFAGKE